MNSSKLVECVSCPVALPEAVAKEVDSLYKTLPSGLEFKTAAMEVEYQFEPGERAEVSILTTRDVDKTGEVVLPEGLELDSYRKSMVVLWNHDKSRPVATCGWIKLYKDQIRAKTIYPEKPEDLDTPWPTDEIWGMLKCVPPILRCKSIGFLPLLPLRDPTPQELQVHPEWAGSGIWEKTLLLEYSLVYHGCNDDAIVLAVNDKSLNPMVLKGLGIPVPEIKPQVKAEPKPEPQPESRLAKYKADDCVSRKIEKLRSEGKEEDQAIAIAYSMCHGKSMVKRKVQKKKTIDINAIMSKVEASIDLDRIIRKAERLWRDRGRV